MSNIKERIIGAVTIMAEDDAAIIWNIITTTFADREWASLPEEEPDEIDLQMLDDIKNNPDCKEFLPSSEVMKMLGL